MARITQRLDRSCKESPDRQFSVVITLKESCRELAPQQLGIQAQPITGVPGILKAKLTGQTILQLGQRSEVEEVTEDFEVTSHHAG